MIPQLLRRLLVPEELESVLAAAPKPVGSLGYDRWGYNTETTQLGLGAAKKIYDHFYRAEAYGLENVPSQGRVLIISNHSGYLPMDAVLIGVALATNPHGPRLPRAMMERFLPSVPYVGNLLNAVGAVVGEVQNCVDMLREEEAIMVFPEGVRGTGKGYPKRYQLQRFGNGFMHLAIETNTPIIPVGVVGCEESFPMFGNIGPLARAMNIPYVPVALPVPLPAKVTIHFGQPLHFRGPVESEQAVTSHVNEVKAAINGLIAEGLTLRKEREMGL